MQKLYLYDFFEILKSRIKSQLISAVCLHFSKKIVNPKNYSLYTENYIAVNFEKLLTSIFELLHKSADFKNVNK